MRRLFLFLKAYQPGLFDEQVTVSGHATKTGKYVAPYQAKRKKRHDEPQAGDLFAEADRKEFKRKYPNYGVLYGVEHAGYPDGKLKVIGVDGTTERFGIPNGEQPKRFKTFDEAATAMEKWLSKQNKKKPEASFAEAAAPKPKESEKATGKEPWEMTRTEWEAEREDIRPRNAQENFTRHSASQGIAQAARLKALLYGVNDAASAKIKAAQKGEIKISKDEAEELLEQINEPVTHRRVIEKAMAEGKPVPPKVLADYPDLQPKEPEQAKRQAEKAPAFDELKKLDLIDEFGGKWRYKMQPGGHWYIANSKDGAIDGATTAYESANKNELMTRQERDQKADKEWFDDMESRYGTLSDDQINGMIDKEDRAAKSLRRPPDKEISDGKRRTGAATSNQGARDAAEVARNLRRYLDERSKKPGWPPKPKEPEQAKRQAEKAPGFKKSATIAEPADELIGEHRRLVRVLRSPSHADDLKEADEQEAELREYEKKAKRKKKLNKAFLVAPLHQLLKARAHA